MSENTSSPHDGAVGYKRPPHSSRFQKGRSGNPRGRPRGSHSALPFDTVLGQPVIVREDGRERRMSAAEAFLLQLTRNGLQGDSAAARASLAAIEQARARRPASEKPPVRRDMRNHRWISIPLEMLSLARKKYPQDERRVRWELEPWLIEAALARLGARQLTEDEQSEVWRATRTPHKVRWPDWWVVRE